MRPARTLLPPRYSGLVVAINGCMFVFGVVLLLMGSLLPTLEVSSTHAGWLGALPLAGILVATIIIGPVLDRTGAKAALVTSLILIFLSLLTLPNVHTLGGVAVIAFVYGVGAGVLNATTNTITATLSATHRGSALNLLGLFFSLGALTTPLLMASTKGHLSPGVILYLLAAVCGLVLIVVVSQGFPPPLRPSTPLRALLPVLRRPVVWMFAAILFFESLQENTMFVWAGRLVDELLHVSASRADVALLGLTAAMGAGRLAASHGLKSVGSPTAIRAAAVIVIAGAAIVVALSASYYGVVAGFVVVGLGLSAIYPTILGLAGDRFPGETGTVFGAIITVSLVGGTIGPIIGGVVSTKGLLYVMAIPAVAAGLILVLTPVVARSRQIARETKRCP